MQYDDWNVQTLQDIAVNSKKFGIVFSVHVKDNNICPCKHNIT